MNRILKTSLAAFALVGLATALVPQASAWTCVGYGTPGSQIAQACNEARETAYYAADEAVDTAEWAIAQIERCLPGQLSWTCYHYP